MSDEFEIYKYKSLTTVLSKVYADYLNVDRVEMQETTTVVMSIFEKIERAMCEDPLFKRMFLKTTVGGSVGDGLKVIIPDEYDLNMVLKLPRCFTVYPSNIPGYVHLKENDGERDISRIKYLPSYLKSTEDSYLLPKQLLPWIQSLLNRALNTYIPDYGRTPLINTEHGEHEVTGIYQIKPGFTLSLDLNDDDEAEEVSVDVVPCFECDCNMLPEKYRQQITQGKCRLIPKEPTRDVPFKERYWRLCFQDFERDMLHDRHVLKPTIKLLKVLKENLDITAVCSYHIKAICLYELQKAGNEFWKEPLGNCFLRLLNACILHIGNGIIPAVYDAKCNLIEHLNTSHCKQISSKLYSVLEEIVQSPDTCIIASYLLDEDDFAEFEGEFFFSERYRELLEDYGYTEPCNLAAP